MCKYVLGSYSVKPKNKNFIDSFVLKFYVLIDFFKKTANTISGLGYRTLVEFELLFINFWSI